MGATSAILGTPMLHRDQRTPFSDWWWTVDKLLLGAIMALMLGGVILSLAASPPVATRIGLDPFHYFTRHVLFLLPALIVLIGVSFLSPKQIRRTALLVFAVSIILIVATLLVGPEVKGSRRWITLIGVNIQASESAKPAFVVMAAWLFAESTKRPEMPATRILCARPPPRNSASSCAWRCWRCLPSSSSGRCRAPMPARTCSRALRHPVLRSCSACRARSTWRSICS